MAKPKKGLIKSFSVVAASRSKKPAKTKKAETKTKAKAEVPAAPASPASPASDVPSLTSILDEADQAFTDLVRRYYALGRAYVKAITYYGAEGKRAFRTRFPLTENALRNLEYVGRGRLLPHFSMCSNRFTCGLVNMTDSLLWQNKLLNISEKGMIKLRLPDGKTVEKSFEDFSNGEIDGVLSIVGSEDTAVSAEELSSKVVSMMAEVRKHFHRTETPAYKIVMKDGEPAVHFVKGKYTKQDLLKIIELYLS